MKKVLKLSALSLLLGIVTTNAHAVSDIWDKLTSKNSLQNYPSIVEELISHGLYHTSVPYLKEYLISESKSDRQRFDRVLEEVITKVGDRQFVLIPEKYLDNSNAPTIKYLLAKKNLKLQKFDEVLKSLNATISKDHPVKPFALQLEGVTFAFRGSYQSAISSFERCVRESQSGLSSTNDPQKVRQLSMNRDYCTVGIARALYAAKEFDKAELKYLDLDKNSYVWPEILVEEAWNSFYKEDYNRTLGKLVTYKAPILKHIFNPEIEVLESMAYLKLCLYDDAVKVVEKFYKKYEKDTGFLESLISKHNNDLDFFFLLVSSYINGKEYSVSLVNDLLKSLIKDPSFLNSIESYNNGMKEIEIIKTIGNKRLAKVLANNLKDSLSLQRKIIGSYAKKSLRVSLSQLKKSFIGMSYIKLEVLRMQKAKLYSNLTVENKLRGDVEYLKRNEKQYFWNFNGEFWADELGDYVFALKSECSK